MLNPAAQGRAGWGEVGEGWCWATSPAKSTALNGPLIPGPHFPLQSSTHHAPPGFFHTPYPAPS